MMLKPAAMMKAKILAKHSSLFLQIWLQKPIDWKADQKPWVKCNPKKIPPKM